MRNVVIIGSGPAGLTAAVYAARANLSPLLIEGWQSGGQLTTTTEVENYPGFAKGIMGPELMKEMRSQAERFGTEFLTGDVTAVDFKHRPFTITVDAEQTIHAKTVIIATGASAIQIGVKNEARLTGHGVSTCATCDGFFFKGKELIVVGGGDSAMEEATFLTKFASKVSIVHRRDKLRASKIMQDRAVKNEKITFVWNSAVEDILGNEVVTGARLKNLVTGKTADLPCAGVFVAIGHRPNTNLFSGQLDMDAKGYIRTTQGTATNIPGVFAAGDVQDSVYRQAVTAAGSGCMAAIDAEQFLEAGKGSRGRGMEKPHKKLDAWREAVELTLSIYHATDNFPREHRFALTDQIHRAALSVASNIAEGAARQTKKEFANFLHIAQASLSELDTQLEIAKKLTFLSGEQWCKLDAQMNHIDKLLSGLIKYLKSGKSQRTPPHPSPLTPHC